MSFSNEVTMPTYFIYRDSPVGQPVDLTAPLLFWPLKDSDELFDALRAKYPHLQKHSERTREAVLEFLVEEQQFAQLQNEQLPTPQTTNSTTTSPWLTSMQSMSSDTSTWSSPDMLGLATPSFGNSPQPQAPSLSRQQSIVTAAPSEQTTPPALEHMTGVFSLSDAAQPKQRIRRKMTEAEKIEYRKRRIVKACEKCSKRKRKCHHNQPELEVLEATKTHKIAKPTAAPTSKKPAAVENAPQIQDQNALLDPSLLNFAGSSGADIAMQCADYSTLFEDPLPDMGLDDLFAPSVPQWPWSDTPDWTLMDSSTDDLTYQGLSHKSEQKHKRELQFQENDMFHDQFNNYNGMSDYDLQYFSEYMNTPQNRDANQPPQLLTTVGMEVPQERQQPTHNVHVHHAEGLGTFVYDQNDLSQGSGRGNDWNETRTYRSQQGPSLAQMTLRLNGTAKAVKAFGNLLQPGSSRRSRLSSVSLKKVAMIALGGTCVAQQQNARLEANNRLLAGNAPSNTVHRDCIDFIRRGSDWSKDLDRHKQRRYQQNETLLEGLFNQQGTPSEPLEGMSIGDYLRMRTNVRPVEEDGRATFSVAPDIHKSRKDAHTSDLLNNAESRSDRGAMSKGLGLNPAPGSSGRMLQHSHTVAQEGRHVPSLGEGISSSKSPSTELFMLKRRIPKALHSIVDRNSPSTPIGPLLETGPQNLDTQTDRDYEREMAISCNRECTESNATLRNGRLGAIANTAQAVHSATGRTMFNTPGFEGEPARYQVWHTADVEDVPRTRSIYALDHADDQSSAAQQRGEVWDQDLMDRHASARAQTAPVKFQLNAIYSGQTNGDLLQTRSAHAFEQAHIQSSADQQITYEGRLSDHVRRRDHFGRLTSYAHAMETFVPIAALGLLLVLLSFLPTTTIDLSLVLLALVSPIRGARGTLHARSKQSASQFWFTTLQCTFKNSVWLNEIQQTEVQDHEPACTFAQRPMYRGCKEDSRIGGTLSHQGAGKKHATCV